jgi:hypothetical protein
MNHSASLIANNLQLVGRLVQLVRRLNQIVGRLNQFGASFIKNKSIIPPKRGEKQSTK